MPTVQLSEFGQLIPTLKPGQLRLVCLYAEAVLLAQEGRTEVRDRLRLIERTFDLALHLMRRRAKDGELRAEHLSVLDREFGISSKWVLEGDTAALADWIVCFCREGEPQADQARSA